MFIADVDQALEQLVRERLPLPHDIGDVSFEPPNETWSASLSRLTINMFLHQVSRSTQPGRAPILREGESDGDRGFRRKALPMIELSYLVSAYAGSPRDEHQLLGSAVSLFAGVGTLPPELTPPTLNSTVSIVLGDEIKPREVWQGVGGKLKASLIIRANVAADTWDWERQAPPVENVSVLSAPNEDGAARGPLAPNWPSPRR